MIATTETEKSLVVGLSSSVGGEVVLCFDVRFHVLYPLFPSSCTCTPILLFPRIVCAGSAGRLYCIFSCRRKKNATAIMI